MKPLRIVALALVSLLALLALALGAVLVSGYAVATAKPGNPLRPLRVPPDSSRIERGRHLALIECAGCHSSNGELPLAGGVDDYLGDPGSPPFGHLVAPNLTPGGPLAGASDGQLARAIREGVGADGRPLLVMPSRSFHRLSDADLAALIAYLRSQSAVRRGARARELTPLAYAVIGLHMFETSRTPPIEMAIPEVPPDSTARYGQYLVSYLGCGDCHGADLHGGRKGQFEPLGPDLVTIADRAGRGPFLLALRAGVSTRDGHGLDPKQMPWTSFRWLDDGEIAAVQNYLRGLAPR